VDKVDEESVQNCAAQAKENLEKESVVSDQEDKYSLTGSAENVEGNVEDDEEQEVKKDDPLDIDCGFVCSFAADIKRIKAAKTAAAAGKEQSGLNTLDSETPSGTCQVQLVSPAMYEEVACQELQEPAGQVTIVPSEDNQSLLGHLQLVSSDAGCSFPVTNLCTIGRDSSCSITLPGREVSRLHAMVVLRDGKVIIESVSKTNHVRINGKMISGGQVVTLVEKDRVEVGREVLVWHREGETIVEEVSRDSSWGKKGSSDDISEGDDDDEREMFEVKSGPNCYSPGPQPVHDYHNQEESTASSDQGSVVVEMVNFIQ